MVCFSVTRTLPQQREACASGLDCRGDGGGGGGDGCGCAGGGGSRGWMSRDIFTRHEARVP